MPEWQERAVKYAAFFDVLAWVPLTRFLLLNQILTNIFCIALPGFDRVNSG